jgi:hypothetical protein
MLRGGVYRFGNLIEPIAIHSTGADRPAAATGIAVATYKPVPN